MMFGLFDGGVKYRSEVTVEIHAILMLMPELKSLLASMPALKGMINDFRKENMPAMEAAAWASLLIIENVMQSVQQDARLLALRYLDAAADDEFRHFARYYQALVANQNPQRPPNMPNLVPVLGFAFWYLGVAVHRNRFSDAAYCLFVGDVVGMLQGKSQTERRGGAYLRKIGSPERGAGASSPHPVFAKQRTRSG
jgi:hypothetical protein